MFTNIYSSFEPSIDNGEPWAPQTRAITVACNYVVDSGQTTSLSTDPTVDAVFVKEILLTRPQDMALTPEEGAGVVYVLTPL